MKSPTPDISAAPEPTPTPAPSIKSAAPEPTTTIRPAAPALSARETAPAANTSGPSVKSTAPQQSAAPTRAARKTVPALSARETAPAANAPASASAPTDSPVPAAPSNPAAPAAPSAPATPATPDAPLFRSDLSLGRLRLRLAARWLRSVGRFLPVVLLFAAGIAALFFAVAAAHPLWAALIAAALVVRFQLTRRDSLLMNLLLRRPRLGAWYDCHLLLLPASLLLLAAGHPWHALVLQAAAPTAALLPRRGAALRHRSLLRIGWLGWSPEWCATLRRHRIATLLLALGALLLAAVPYWSFIYLGFTALAAVECYTRNEPLALLLLPELESGRLLARKVFEALRNYLLATAPFALAAALLHPRAAWVAALWLAFSTLVLLYAVLAKYALYDPDEPRPVASTVMLFGLIGFLLPPLLPVSLVLLVRYGLRAERNLNRYLHDYSR